MKISNSIKTITNLYNKISNVGKILLFITLLLILVVLFNSIKISNVLKEGYQQNDTFIHKEGTGLYDNFYADIYDLLVFNNLKDDYEIGQIINRTNANTQSKILDIGCGTGHHVAKLNDSKMNVIGLDISPAMINKAKENYPGLKFIIGDALNSSEFTPDNFTHILCLYFTIYYMKNKQLFFNNCYEWLMPGGTLVVHLVDREKFDPILPPGNPLYVVSPQKYAKERITKTKVNFNDFVYTSNFELEGGKDLAIFDEKFKFTNGKIRKHEHKLYMESITDILNLAQNAGFIIQGKIDLVKCAYEYQYLFILQKPN